MTAYKQGDVLLVPYPFTDQSGSKQRPSVVVSGDGYNQTHPDVILAPITSQIRHTTDDWERCPPLIWRRCVPFSPKPSTCCRLWPSIDTPSAG